SMSGLVAFDLAKGSLKWQSELSISRRSEERALIYGSPVAADLDGDGTLELVVADGMGHIHVLSARGKEVPPWPLRVGPLGAQVVVEDLNGDGRMELLVLDAAGNLVCFDLLAKELWLVHIFTGSDPPLDHAPTVGDVDGDGTLDVVVGTAA